MTEESRFVHIVDDVPELAEDSRPVLLHALEGFLDAGSAAALAVTRLQSQSSGRVVASFDMDAFYDYRARRPPLIFAEDHYEEYAAPRLVVRLLHDDTGTPYLLLHGPEPDTYWEAFAAAVREVVDRFGVRLSVALGSVPMAVPHTRPVMLTHHATDTGLLVQENVWKGRIRVPSSAQALLEVRLGEWGHGALGFVAHIPHYVAQIDYPLAAAALLEAVHGVTGLEWDLTSLQVAGEERLAEINAQVHASPEVGEVVEGLEQQYDALRNAGQGANLPLADEQRLPSGEELGEEFERFLAGLNNPDQPEE